MKQFEVGKRYMVRAYSYTKGGRKDYNHPETMVVVKRTDTHIWCEIESALCIKKQTCKVLKWSAIDNVEQINCALARVRADNEL